jgi:hypothetical protein
MTFIVVHICRLLHFDIAFALSFERNIYGKIRELAMPLQVISGADNKNQQALCTAAKPAEKCISTFAWGMRGMRNSSSLSRSYVRIF